MSRMVRTLLLAALAVVLGACTPAPAASGGGIAIYLPAQPMSGREVLAADLNTLTLQSQPIIAADEILSYSASSHDLTLAPGAIARLRGFKVPVQGLGFVIRDGSAPLLAGAFWTPISSLSFDGLTINVPLEAKGDTLHLYSGYPMLDAAVPNDPRDDARLLDGFRRMGKLR